MYLPGSQPVQAPAPLLEEYIPAGQFLQVVDPSVEYLPGSQSIHPVLSVLGFLPAGQVSVHSGLIAAPIPTLLSVHK